MSEIFSDSSKCPDEDEYDANENSYNPYDYQSSYSDYGSNHGKVLKTFLHLIYYSILP